MAAKNVSWSVITYMLRHEPPLFNANTRLILEESRNMAKESVAVQNAVSTAKLRPSTQKIQLCKVYLNQLILA